jgi:hypothetical protein
LVEGGMNRIRINQSINPIIPRALLAVELGENGWIDGWMDGWIDEILHSVE